MDVYQRQPHGYIKLDGIRITKLTKPSDIAACGVKKRVYVADSENFGIWLVRNPLSDESIVEHFAKVRRASGMSVTQFQYIVVVTELADLIVFDSDGRAMSKIVLSDKQIGLSDPLQAVLLPTGHFIICSGLCKNKQHTVVKMSVKKEIQVSLVHQLYLDNVWLTSI